MNTDELNASSRILILSTGYNNSGFLGGLNSILNQLLYAEEFGFIPVVYFNPGSNEFPDFNRQRLFQQNEWQLYFESVGRFSYEEVLQFIDSSDHPLTIRNLHFLTNQEMLYLNFGKPESIFYDYYGYYKYHQEHHAKWLGIQRSKARALKTQYIRFQSSHIEKSETYIKGLGQKSTLLGVVVDSFERFGASNDHRSNLKAYFEFIDEYVKNNPQCKILLVSGNQKFIKSFQSRYDGRIKLPDANRPDKFKRFYELLMLSKCDFLLKDHSALGEFVLYLNPELTFKDIQDELLPYSSVVSPFIKFFNELNLFRKRWTNTIKVEDLSLKVIARQILLYNPITQLCRKSLEKHRFSRFVLLRWSVLFIDFIKLIRARDYYPITRIKHRAAHAANHIGADFFDYNHIAQKKYFEIRNAWDTNTGFFAYMMMALSQLRFAEIHGLTPIVNFNEPHNHYFEAGHNRNIWENYFEPVTDINSSDFEKLDAGEVTFLDHDYHKRPGNAEEPPEADEIGTKLWFESHRALRAILTKKYIRPKAFILEMVNKYYTLFMDGHSVLGVHIRGTDKDIDQKGKRYEGQEKLIRKIGPNEYFPYVDRYLSFHTDAKIFVATDQQQYLDEFTEHYGDRIISIAAMRTTSDEPLFRQNKGSKFQKGVEVFCDSLLLSRCDFLIKGWSNVSEAAICFNPSIPVVDIMYIPNLDEIDFEHPKPAVPKELMRLHEHLIGNNAE